MNFKEMNNFKDEKLKKSITLYKCRFQIKGYKSENTSRVRVLVRNADGNLNHVCHHNVPLLYHYFE